MTALAAVKAPPDWDPNDTNLWTMRECASFLGMTRAALYHVVEAGEIPCVRFGRSIRFIPSKVRGWVMSKEVRW